LRYQLLQLRQDDPLHPQGEQDQVFGADVEDVVKHGITPVRDRRDLEHAGLLRRRVVQPVVPEGTVVLPGVGPDLPFDHDLGIGGNGHVHRFAGNDLHGLSEQTAHRFELELPELAALL